MTFVLPELAAAGSERFIITAVDSDGFDAHVVDGSGTLLLATGDAHRRFGRDQIGETQSGRLSVGAIGVQQTVVIDTERSRSFINRVVIDYDNLADFTLAIYLEACMNRIGTA